MYMLVQKQDIASTMGHVMDQFCSLCHVYKDIIDGSNYSPVSVLSSCGGSNTLEPIYYMANGKNIPGGKVRGQLTVPCRLYQIMPGQCITDLGPSFVYSYAFEKNS